MIPVSARALADDSECGGCNAGRCVEPAVSNLSTNVDPSLGGRPSCDCKGTGFIGEHCDVPCSMQCQNGGKCLPASEDGMGESCGCSKAVVNGNPFAGLTCEYGATKSCMHLESESKHSFCTNGGECSNIVGDNEQHMDCVCKGEFEGPHCEFVAGMAAQKALAGASGAAEGAYHPKTNSKSDLVVYIMILVIAALIGVLLLAFGVRSQRRRSEAKRRENQARLATEELSMIPTHNRPENENGMI